jgi:hypothetical protein
MMTPEEEHELLRVVIMLCHSHEPKWKSSARRLQAILDRIEEERAARKVG